MFQRLATSSKGIFSISLQRFGKMVPLPEKNFSQSDFAFVVTNGSLSIIPLTSCFSSSE